MPQTTTSDHLMQMGLRSYPMPAGCRLIPHDLLDLRPDSDIDHDILHPGPVTDDKNVWFFWDSGYAMMPPYSQRTIRNWHRRFSKMGWAIRVVDRVPDSPLNIAALCDIHDTRNFPKAFADETIAGAHAAQCTSDMVRWPLLLKYGGVYADVGVIQIDDLDLLWNRTVANPDSPYDVIAYNCGGPRERSLANYFLAARRNNPFFERCHRLLIALWAEDGGKHYTDGMSKSPLLKGTPHMEVGSLSFEEDGRIYGPDEIKEMLADYIIHGYTMTAVLGLVDEEDDWNGPGYCVKHIYAMDYMVGSQLINEMTAWDGARQFRLLTLQIPKESEVETEEQREAREIVVACLTKSFGFKLAHGLIIRVYGDTLGSLWKKNLGSDIVPGTYADWLRYGTLHWVPEKTCPRMDFQMIMPFKIGPLLSEC